MILLDSDVMIDLLREYPPAVAWFDALDEDEEIALPGIEAYKHMMAQDPSPTQIEQLKTETFWGREYANEAIPPDGRAQLV